MYVCMYVCIYICIYTYTYYTHISRRPRAGVLAPRRVQGAPLGRATQALPGRLILLLSLVVALLVLLYVVLL